MMKALPKWAMVKYSRLWNEFSLKEFTNEEATKAIKESDPHQMSTLFSRLKVMGWVDIRRDTNDMRKKIYKLKEPNKAVKELGNVKNK